MERLTKVERQVNQVVGQYPVASAVGSGVLTGLLTGTLYSTTAWLFARSQGATAGLIWKNALLWGALAGTLSGVLVATKTSRAPSQWGPPSVSPEYDAETRRMMDRWNQRVAAERRGKTSSTSRRRRSSAA
jgi:hypothetical protein